MARYLGQIYRIRKAKERVPYSPFSSVSLQAPSRAGVAGSGETLEVGSCIFGTLKGLIWIVPQHERILAFAFTTSGLARQGSPQTPISPFVCLHPQSWGWNPLLAASGRAIGLGTATAQSYLEVHTQGRDCLISTRSRVCASPTITHTMQSMPNGKNNDWMYASNLPSFTVSAVVLSCVELCPHLLREQR